MKKYFIISNAKKKAHDTIQHPLMTELPQPDKGLCDASAHTALHGEEEAFTCG